MPVAFYFGLFAGFSLGLLTITKNAWAWGYSAGSDYSSPFAPGDSTLSFGLAANHNYSERWGVQCSQGFEKSFFIDASAPEWELADTVLGLNLYPRTLIPGITWVLRLQASLPLSITSQANEIYSKPEARMSASTALTEQLKLGLDSSIRLTLSRYDSTPTENGVGGTPLPEYSYGLGHSGIWQFLPQLSAGYRLSYSEIKFHALEYSGPGQAKLFAQPDQAYSLAVSGSWLFLTNTTLSLAYSYGGILLQPGLDDYVIFDEDSSRWSIGLALSIP